MSCRFESGRFSSTSSTQARITADLLICRRLASASTRCSSCGGNLSEMVCMAVRYDILAKAAIPIRSPRPNPRGGAGQRPSRDDVRVLREIISAFRSCESFRDCFQTGKLRTGLTRFAGVLTRILCGWSANNLVIAAAPELDQAEPVTERIGHVGDVPPLVSLDLPLLARSSNVMVPL